MLMLISNDEGNECLDQADYRKAVEKYEKAIQFDPNDAVVHSNLALAWENLREPGESIEALECARGALQRALQLDPQNEDYKKRLKQLKQRR
jgi:Tfp pilus assembly protein PilF